jgi:hypothetical protein
MRGFLAILVLGALSGLATGCGALVDTPDGGADIDQLLTPDENGWIDKSTTGTTGIQGQWRALADDLSRVPALTAGGCQTDAYGECSTLHEPVLGRRYAPTAGLGMCTSGVIARWIAVAGSNGITPDGSSGRAGIVLDLKTPDWPEPRESSSPPTGKMYDAAAHGVTGFAFDLDAEPPPGARPRVEVATVGPERESPDPDPAYWGGAHLDRSPVHAGHNEFWWNDAGPIPFYRRRVLRIGFVVSGSEDKAVSYNFCIDHLTALRSSGGAPAMIPPVSAGQLLVPDLTGWVDRSTTGKTQIQGSWYVAADSIGSKDVPPTCQGAGHADADCSLVSEPDLAALPIYPPTNHLGMCMSGVVAPRGPDPGNIWGALIGFGLNFTGAPEFGSEPYDAPAHGVTGFAFDIDAEPGPGVAMVVTVGTEATELRDPQWLGGNPQDPSPVHAGRNEFKWKDVGGPWWSPNPPPFDPRLLTAINFSVAAGDRQKHPLSYNFCINNLTALLD